MNHEHFIILWECHSEVVGGHYWGKTIEQNLI